MTEKVNVNWVSEREVWIEEDRLYLGEDNILYIDAVGEANKNKATAVKEVILKFINVADRKLNILIDFNKTGKNSKEARKIWSELDEYENSGTIAFYGLHPVARMIMSFAIGKSKNKNIRFFRLREEALKWLKAWIYYTMIVDSIDTRICQ